MSNSDENPREQLRAAMRAHRRGMRTRLLCRGLLLWGGVLCGLVVLLAIVDAWVVVPTFAAALIPALVTAAILATFDAFVRRPFRALGDLRRVALHLENTHPECGEALLTAIEYLEAPPSALVDEVIRWALVRVQALPTTTGVRWCIAAVLLGGGATLALLTGNGIVERGRSIILKFARPFAAPPIPEPTTLTVEEPQTFPVFLRRGDGLTLRVRIGGSVPESLACIVRADDGSAATFRMRTQTAGLGEGLAELRLTDALLADAAEIRVMTGETAAVIPIRRPIRPRLRELRFRIRYPSYTGLTAEELPIDAPIPRARELPLGTVIELRARVEPAVRSVAVLRRWEATEPFGLGACLLGADRPSSGVMLPGQVSPDGREIELAFRPFLGGTWEIQLVTVSGEIATHSFLVPFRADPPPIVRVDWGSKLPEKELPIGAEGFVPCRIVAQDERYGLRGLGVEITAMDGKVLGRIETTTASAARARDLHFQGGLSPALIEACIGRPIAVGEALTLHAVAWDNDPFTPHKPLGRSREALTIRRTTREELTAMIDASIPELLHGVQGRLDAWRRAGEAAENADRKIGRLDDMRELVEAAARIDRWVRVNRLADTLLGQSVCACAELLPSLARDAERLRQSENGSDNDDGHRRIPAGLRRIVELLALFARGCALRSEARHLLREYTQETAKPQHLVDQSRALLLRIAHEQELRDEWTELPDLFRHPLGRHWGGMIVRRSLLPALDEPLLSLQESGEKPLAEAVAGPLPGLRGQGLRRVEYRAWDVVAADVPFRLLQQVRHLSEGGPTGREEPAFGPADRSINLVPEAGPWGELPAVGRREIERFERGDFMPEYAELLAQYYRALASEGTRK